jgi:hypothetical protein
MSCKAYCLISLFFVFILISGINAAESGLVGWWKLDEGAGSTVADSSGGGHDGFFVDGNPEWVEGLYAGALKFDGVNKVEIPDHTEFHLEDAVSAALWVKPESGQKEDAKFFIKQKSTYYPYCLQYDGNSQEIYANISSDSTQFNTRPRLANFPGQWAHLCFTYDGSVLILYKDGEEVARVAASGKLRQNDLSLTIGGRLNSGNNFKGIIDDVRLYNRALTQQEILQVMQGPPAGPASKPSPALGEQDVSRDVILSWTPGEFADKHNVYFGTDFDNINNADVNSPLLIGPDLDINTFTPGRLDFDQTYYWRVDEISAPPDNTIYKGDLWSFTVEPFAITIDRIIATASSQEPDQGPENTVDGSGLVNDLHSTNLSDMWLSGESDTGPAWIQFDFNKALKLHEMLVWNYNQEGLNTLYGLRDVIIEHSTDGTNWTPLSDVPEFPKASGNNNYAPMTINLDNVIARYIKITAQSNWSSGLFNQCGLSEVRFMAIPVSARRPSPGVGDTNASIDVTLGWRAGREAAEHKVYLSKSEQAVIDGTAFVDTVGLAEYGPLSLDLDNTYYWRIDEVNNAETPTTWQGDVWSFTTQQYLVVDDFESYNDIEAGQEGSNLVYDTWTDGYLNPSTNGSTIGYASGASMETATVHGGKQSVPVLYDNTTASISVVTIDPGQLPIGRDWTKGSPQALVLWVYGDFNNTAADRMYVKVNNAKVVYNGDLAQAQWQEFQIDLAALGVDLSNVTSLVIGFERTSAASGSGIVFIDDIRLYGIVPAS